MELIDKRGILLTTTFDDLYIGDCYQDDEDHICIKTSRDRCIYFDTAVGQWRSSFENLDELIIPLKATITVERSE
jgi:hypothetical protein